MKTPQDFNQPSNHQWIVRRSLLSLLPLVIVFAGLFTSTPGGASNQVIITEFSDFQCPYCKRAATVVEQVRKTYGARVEVVFKQMPLRMHQHAFQAAQASVCARAQGKFWEYHDQLFAASKLSADELGRAAAAIGLNQTDFNRCLSSKESKAEVEQDAAEAERLGVSGTPTFFINGKIVKGAASFAALKLRIDQEMDQRMISNNHASVSGISQRELTTNGRASATGNIATAFLPQSACVPFPMPTVSACAAVEGGLPTDFLTLYPSNPTLAANCSAQFSVLLGAGTQQCNFTTRVQQWTSSNPSVAMIDATGNTVALAAGTTTITATEFIGTSSVQTSTTLTVQGSAPTPTPTPTATPTPTPTPAPPITLSQTTINFGYQLVGTTSSQITESVINSGTAPLVIKDIMVIGRDRDDFKQADSFSLPVSIAPGNNFVVNLAFTPVAPWRAGTRDAKLKIQHTHGVEFVTLIGTGVNCGGPVPGCSSGCADADGDGLNDAWETAGGVDLNNDGEIATANDLLLSGSERNKPDIFVWYDWMGYGGNDQSCATSNDCRGLGTSHLGETCNGEGQCVYSCSSDSDCTSRWPTEAHAGERCVSNTCEHTHDPLVLDRDAFRLVVAQFANHGINLHILRGSAQPHSHVVSQRSNAEMTISCEGASVTSGKVGLGRYAASFYDLKARGNPDKLNVAYHYAIFSHYSSCDSSAHCPGNAGNSSNCQDAGSTFGQAGVAERSGNDFIVSLGGLVNDSGLSPRFQVAGTFMHELGHDLGLRHDGHLDQPCPSGAGCPTGDTCIDLDDGQGRVCHETVGGLLRTEEPNYKPNYLSIMNYRYERTFIQIGAGIGSRVPLRCTNDFDCGGNGAFCVLRNTGNHCSVSGHVCTTGSDCAIAGESCVPPEPVFPNTCSTTGYVCSTDADCTGGDTCLPPSPGYCARMDYSRQTLPTGGLTPGALDEANLDDTVGLGSGTSDLFTYNDALCHTCWLTAPTTGPVNWGGTGVYTDPLCSLYRFGVESFTDTHVQADVDETDFTQCRSDAHDLLHGHIDWPDLSGIPFNYKFQCTPNGGN